MHFDTPEPSLEDLMQAYPEGQYRFQGRTAAGEKLAGVADLSYELLPAPTILFPPAGETDVPTKDLGSAVVRARRSGTDPAPGGG